MQLGQKNLKSVSQKQTSGGVLIKKCSEIMQQIHKRTLMSKCDFNKVAKHIYWRIASGKS